MAWGENSENSDETMNRTKLLKSLEIKMINLLKPYTQNVESSQELVTIGLR